MSELHRDLYGVRVNKIWGTTELVQKNPACEMHNIHVVEGGFCSIHRHKTKFNLFLVLRGELRVITYPHARLDAAGNLLTLNAPETWIIRPEGSHAVPPGIFHQFASPTGAHAIELYWSQYDADDIERISEGGIDRFG